MMATATKISMSVNPARDPEAGDFIRPKWFAESARLKAKSGQFPVTRAMLSRISPTSRRWSGVSSGCASAFSKARNV